MKNINIFIEEFLKENRTRLREACSDEDLYSESPLSSNFINEGLTAYNLQKPHSHENNKEPTDLLPKVKIVGSCGKQNMKIRLKQNDAIPGPKVCFGALRPWNISSFVETLSFFLKHLPTQI